MSVGVYCYKRSLWHHALGMKESFTERNPRLVKYSIQIDFATNHRKISFFNMDPNQQIARGSTFFSHTPPKTNMLNPQIRAS